MSNSLVPIIIGLFAFLITIMKHFSEINSIIQGINNMDFKFNENKLNLINILGCGLWIIYAIKHNDLPIFLTYIVLFFIYIFFMNTYFWYNHEKDKMYKYSVLCTIFVILSYYLLQETIAGLFAMIITLYLYFFLIKRIKRRLETKSKEETTLLETQMSVASCGLWVIYGLILTDQTFVWISNLIGFILTSINLFCFYWIMGTFVDNHFIVINLKKVFQVGNKGKNEVLVVENTNKMNKSLKDDF